MINIKDEPKLYQNPLYTGKLRNALCPCNSGKKVKKCHGIKRAITASEHNVISRAINDRQKEYDNATKD